LIRNFFTIAWRNIVHNKTFSFIHVIGLSIGISASLVIYLVVSYDFSFDKVEKDADRIYRVVTHSINAGVASFNGGVTYPLSEAMRKDLSGLDLVVPVFTWFPEKVSLPVKANEKPKQFRQQKHIAFVDGNYFNLVQYEWLAGSPKTSLTKPYEVVLTESNANLYFPNLSPDDIIGKTLYFSDTLGTIVTGIVKDLPYNTDFTIKAFISRLTLEATTISPVNKHDWGPIIGLSQLFVKLSKGVIPDKMESEISLLIKKHGINRDPDGQYQTSYKLQPLNDLHFNHLYGNIFGYDEMAHKPALYGLLAIAAFLLLLACINFINLTTAQSSQRAKEIGIRKTLGISRRQLIIQFLSETFMLTLLAILLSILLTPFLLRIFSNFIPKGLHFSFVSQPRVFVFGGLLLVAVSLISGLYPAMILSACKPTLALKNLDTIGGGKNGRVLFRKTLTVFQFIVAQVFVIGTLLVSKQISFLLHKDLGFKKDAIVYFYTSFYDTARQNRLVLLDKLKAISGITMTSLAGNAPFSNSSWNDVVKFEDGKKEVETEIEIKYIDTNYCRLYQIKLLAGKELPYSDTIRSLLINETYAHILGFRDLREVIGKSIEWNNNRRTIVGVVADFHQKSLHTLIKPLVMTSQVTNEGFISVALAPQNDGGKSWRSVITNMQKAWSSVYPEEDFNYAFQDEEIAKAYKSEQEIMGLLNWATALAIFISCLGLLGLVIFTTNRRTKEIGIRKIVGATVTQIIFLLSSDLLKLVGWAFLIAVPIAWWGAHSWLNNYAYRVNLEVWTFLAGGFIMGGIAFFILLLRTFKAATANPANSLRTE
jgi:putative ABC transport system permease protein